MEKRKVQITSGRGPRECEWVVAKTLAFLTTEAQKEGIKVSLVDPNYGKSREELSSVTVQLKGNKLNAFLKHWLGTIQWVGQSPFRKFHKRKNWFIGVFEVAEKETICFDENQVSYQTMRSSGAGGQHVNKVSSAVRAIHVPTGTTVVSMDSRSQIQNKKLALGRLKQKLNEINEGKMNDSIIDQWSNHLELQRGNPVKVFYGDRFKQKNK